MDKKELEVVLGFQGKFYNQLLVVKDFFSDLYVNFCFDFCSNFFLFFSLVLFFGFLLDSIKEYIAYLQISV